MIILQYLVNFGVQMKKIKFNKVASNLHLLVLFFREISADVKEKHSYGSCVPNLRSYSQLRTSTFEWIPWYSFTIQVYSKRTF